MKTRIYVGNLAYTTTASDIRQLFETFGEVVSCYLYSAGKSRFSFVQMSNEADGESAIEALNNRELLERRLIVQWAQKQRRERHRWSAAEVGEEDRCSLHSEGAVNSTNARG